MENASASEPYYTFTIFEFFLADGARSVVTIEYYVQGLHQREVSVFYSYQELASFRQEID